MVKLLIFIAVFQYSQISTGGRTVPDRGNPEKDTISDRDKSDADIPAVIDSNSAAELRFDSYRTKSKWPVPEFDRDLSGSGSTKYIASIRLEELLGHRPEKGHLAPQNGSVLIGIKRPSYRLVGRPYVRGNVDLRMGASIFGLDGRGLVTVSYYLKSDDSYSHISTTLSLVGFSYRFIIPLGFK